MVYYVFKFYGNAVSHNFLSFREERIQNYMSTKNGQPHGTFLVPPDVEQHDCKKHQSFYVFQNQTNCKNKSQYERLFNGEKEYDPKTHRDDRAHAKSKVSDLIGRF